MSDENYIAPNVAAQARHLALQLAASDDSKYDRAIDLLSLLGRNLPDDVPGQLYAVWGELTDAWELDPDRRVQTEATMNEAALDLARAESESDFGGYLSKWSQQLSLE